MFDTAVYRRGGMTLQALREKIGARAQVLRILRTWAATHRYGNGSTAQFVALSERIAHMDLTNFFQVWIYSPGKPATW